MFPLKHRLLCNIFPPEQRGGVVRLSAWTDSQSVIQVD